MYLPEVTREMVDFVHLHGLGDVLEDHRSHVLIAMLEECGLPLDDGARNLHERLVADLEALQQPTRLLQLRTHARVTCVAPDQARIAVVQAHARQRGGVDLDAPAVIRAAHEDIGDARISAAPPLTVAPGRG